MSLQEQIKELIEGYGFYLSNTSVKVLEIKAIIDIILLLEKNIDMIQKRMFFNKHDFKRLQILENSLKRLQERHKKTINYLYQIKKN
tara:strand:- start:2689 stop:2949 length:261 start_codon:yes stop_codon:yes gene_type:complete